MMLPIHLLHLFAAAVQKTLVKIWTCLVMCLFQCFSCVVVIVSLRSDIIYFILKFAVTQPSAIISFIVKCMLTPYTAILSHPLGAVLSIVFALGVTLFNIVSLEPRVAPFLLLICFVLLVFIGSCFLRGLCYICCGTSLPLTPLTWTGIFCTERGSAQQLTNIWTNMEGLLVTSINPETCGTHRHTPKNIKQCAHPHTHENIKQCAHWQKHQSRTCPWAPPRHSFHQVDRWAPPGYRAVYAVQCWLLSLSATKADRLKPRDRSTSACQRVWPTADQARSAALTYQFHQWPNHRVVPLILSYLTLSCRGVYLQAIHVHVIKVANIKTDNCWHNHRWHNYIVYYASIFTYPLQCHSLLKRSIFVVT